MSEVRRHCLPLTTLKPGSEDGSERSAETDGDVYIYERGAFPAPQFLFFFPTEEVACQVSHVHSKKLTLVMEDRQEMKRSGSQKCSSEFLISASSPKQWS